MSEQRLQEIKDSIEFQLAVAKSVGIRDEIAEEEKELYDEVIRLGNVINELEKELNKDYETYICKNKSYGKTFKAGANIYREHILYKLKELKENRDEG